MLINCNGEWADDKDEMTHTLSATNYLGYTERSKISVPEAVRKSTGFDLEFANVRVIAEINPAESGSRYWSYLPTAESAGFGVQIHADFYLSNSRRNLTLPSSKSKPGDDPAGWNGQLVQLAAECIIDLWQTRAVCEAVHFWRFATPRACDCPYLRRIVALLFWQTDATLLITMLQLSFPDGKAYPLNRYREFFEAVEAWADYGYRELGRGSLSNQRLQLIKQIQASCAPVLPIVSCDPSDGSASPVDVRRLVAGEKGKSRAQDQVP